MQSIYRFQTRQSIYYGFGSFSKVGELAKELGTKALIVSDAIMDGLGYVSQCQSILQKENISAVVYLGVKTEPTDQYVEEALRLLEENGCDLIISIGGGSCIDTAKAVSVLAANPGHISDYADPAKNPENSPIPHIAIPTTAGTGSEVTDVTVITITKTDVKQMVKRPAFLPAGAIVDPELTMSSPKSVTASTGLDAMTHAIEAYISRKAQPITDMFALTALENLIPAIRTAYENGNDREARSKMAYGSMLAGLAFSNASVCLVHGMSRPIGAVFHVPHGLSNAMLLPAVMEFTVDSCVERLAVIGRMFAGGQAKGSERDLAQLAIDRIKELVADLNIPNLRDWGIEESVFVQHLPKMARDALASGSPQNNPRVPTAEEIIELYKVCYAYDFGK